MAELLVNKLDKAEVKELLRMMGEELQGVAGKPTDASVSYRPALFFALSVAVAGL